MFIMLDFSSTAQFICFSIINAIYILFLTVSLPYDTMMLNGKELLTSLLIFFVGVVLGV